MATASSSGRTMPAPPSGETTILVPFRMLLTKRAADRYRELGWVFQPEPHIQPEMGDPGADLVGKRFRVTLP